jgi:fatty acid desaturase
MEAPRKKQRVAWYRPHVGREDMKSLNQKSDFWGFAQTLGFLGLLALTGSAACLSPLYVPDGWFKWPLVVLIFFMHGTCWQFLINGFHELVHDSVFKTRFLNEFFLRIFSFLGWYDHHYFWASHTEHHKYTLHPPDDQEVVLPVRYTLAGWLKGGFVNPMMIRWMIQGNLQVARGRLAGDWEHALFDNAPPQVLHARFRWARILLIGHGAIIAGSIYMHWWLLPLVITFARCYGSALHILLNSTQHVGLRDNVPDFRLCCRTIYLNPFFQFLYWHMNFHTEHHMFAGVPCYNLPRLHRIIKAEMPRCTNGIVETWREIDGIFKRQDADPAYQYSPGLPTLGGGSEEEPAAEETNTQSPSISLPTHAEVQPSQGT